MNRGFWVFVGMVLLAMVSYMVLPFFDVLIYGLFIYYVARPLYRRVKRVTGGVTVPASVSLFLVTLPVIVVLLYTLIISSTEVLALMSYYGVDARVGVRSIVEKASQIASDIKPEDLVGVIEGNRSVEKYLVSVFSIAVNLVFKLALTFLAAFMFLVDEGRFRRWLVSSLLKKDAHLAEVFLSDVDSTVSQVFVGSILTAGVTAVFGVVVFSLLNVLAPYPSLAIPSPILLGILCGFANMIPTIGIKLVWIPLLLYLLASSAAAGILVSGVWFLALFVVLVTVVVDSVPEYIVRPYAARGRVHPLIMLLSYIFGPIVFGFSGLFVGPIIVVTTESFMRTVLPKLRK